MESPQVGPGASTARGRLRLLPPLCFLVGVTWALARRLRFRRQHVGRALVMDDGRRFRVFRHLSLRRGGEEARSPGVLFVVRFRFASGSWRLNRLLSLLPVLAIGGFPGFRDKLWMVDERGWWQGVYEWESARAVKAYRASLVLRTMERRAVPESLSFVTVESARLTDWMDERAHRPARDDSSG